MSKWPVDPIPDDASLFYRVPVAWRPDLKPAPGVFRENKGSMSTDWEKYSTAEATRARQGRPERFAVLRLVAGGIRDVRGMRVEHSPIQNREGIPDNRAHTDVMGLESEGTIPELGRKERIRTELFERFHDWEIPPNAPIEPNSTPETR
jgi:hypothetical protein